MAGRGGANRGQGRKPGSRDRKTLEAELTVALAQLKELTEKRQDGKKLAIDVLDDVMHLTMGLAAQHQPLAPGEVLNASTGRAPDDAKFERYLAMTIDTAGKLANFQSPKFKSVVLSVEAPPGGVPVDGAGAHGSVETISPAQAYRMLRDRDVIDLTPVGAKPPEPLQLPPATKKAKRA